MSKIIYVCARNNLPSSVEQRLRDICKNLEPDNIAPPDAKILAGEKVAYGVMNPSSCMLERDTSIVIGQLFEEKDVRWDDPSQGLIDGSYALFRDGSERLEVMSDPVGSRTIWFYMDGEVFVASTSQRAIIMFIGGFELNERVIPWMLSTGSLGPFLSWDRRIDMLPPDSSLILDKKNWSISIKSNPIEFTPSELPEAQLERRLREALRGTFESLELDVSRWVLPLSGGYDSRYILFMLRDTVKDAEHVRTVTWGLESSLLIEGNDAYVSRKLAATLGVSNEYYNTDLSEEPDIVVNRFLLLGEGRIDHIAAYMDGFEMWRRLFNEGVIGVIRGDEGFGWNRVRLPIESEVRHSIGCTLCSDFRNLNGYKKYGLATQGLPEYFTRIARETLATYRDRLYMQYRLPTVLSALSDLKLSYLEQVSPLLSRRTLQQVVQQPDSLRTNKALFKKIVASISPQVEFATSAAIASTQNILTEERMAHLIDEELSSENAKSVFPAKFLEAMLSGLGRKASQPARASKSALYLSRAKKAVLGRTVDDNTLAFRAFIISRMKGILEEDSARVY